MVTLVKILPSELASGTSASMLPKLFSSLILDLDTCALNFTSLICQSIEGLTYLRKGIPKLVGQSQYSTVKKRSILLTVPNYTSNVTDLSVVMTD